MILKGTKQKIDTADGGRMVGIFGEPTKTPIIVFRLFHLRIGSWVLRTRSVIK